jgi:hypothetical protein
MFEGRLIIPLLYHITPLGHINPGAPDSFLQDWGLEKLGAWDEVVAEDNGNGSPWDRAAHARYLALQRAAEKARQAERGTVPGKSGGEGGGV